MKTMKTLTVVVLTLALTVGMGMPAFAQQTQITGTASLTIADQLTFGFVQVRQNARTSTDPLAGTIMTGTTGFTFAFDPLYKQTDGTYTGTWWYSIFMIPVTSGRAYNVSQTGSVTAGTFPTNAVFVTPDYNSLDRFDSAVTATAQGLLTAGESLGPPASVVPATSNRIYTSSTGRTRILRTYLVIGAPKAGDLYPSNYSKGYDGSTPDASGSKQFFTAWTPITDSTGGSGSGQPARVSITLTLALGT